MISSQQLDRIASVASTQKSLTAVLEEKFIFETRTISRRINASVSFDSCVARNDLGGQSTHRGWVVIAEDLQTSFTVLANSHLGEQGEKVARLAARIFTNLTRGMCARGATSEEDVSIRVA